MRYNTFLASSFVLFLDIINFEGIELTFTDPCTAASDPLQQKLGHYIDGVTEQSTKMCHEMCTDSSNGYDSNGICVMDRCYCTDVGVGTCEDNNHEGCDAICQSLSLDWVGVCSDEGCLCLN